MDLILLLLSNCANDPQTSNFSKKHLWQLISTSSLISMKAWLKMFATKFLNFESPKNYPRISNTSCIKSKFEPFGFLQYAACVTAIQSPTHPSFYLHFYWQHRRSRLAKKGCSTPPTPPHQESLSGVAESISKVGCFRGCYFLHSSLVHFLTVGF